MKRWEQEKLEHGKGTGPTAMIDPARRGMVASSP